MVEMNGGVYLVGIYLGWKLVNGKDGNRVAISVAAGLESYRVYLEGDGGGEIQAHQQGEKIVVCARPYAGKYGVGWGDAQIIGWPDDKLEMAG